MSIHLARRVGRLAIALTLVTGLMVSAMAQDAEDFIDLDGEWRFEEAVVKVTRDGNTVRADFIEGAECFDGEIRPYLLRGELSGNDLTGKMMVCSGNPRLVEECPLSSSMYETTFKGTIEASRIAGTRVAQGIAAEEKDGRFTNCRPDTRYDETRSFELTRRGCDPSLWGDYRRKEATALELLAHSRDLMRQGTVEAEAFVVDFLANATGQMVGDINTADAVQRSKSHYVHQLGKLVEDVQVLGDDQVRMLSPGYRGAGAVGTASTIGTMLFIANELYRAIDTTRRIAATHAEAREAFDRAADLLDAALQDFRLAMDQLEDCWLEEAREREQVRDAEEFLERAKALRDEWDLGTGLYRDAEGRLYDAAGALERAKRALQELDGAATPAAAEEATRTAIEQIRAAADAFGLGMDAFGEALDRAADLEDSLDELLKSREQAEDIPVA